MPSKPSRGEQLSPVDHAWLRMEDPTNLMMVTGIMIFDQPLDFERLRATFEHRMLSHRRFRQRVVTSADGARWEDDPNFTLSAHLRRIALPAPHDQAALQELVSDMMSTPVDFSKSPWQYHLIENYNGGCVLLGRLHHCIADGIALIRVLLSMTDATADAPWPSATPEAPAPEREPGGTIAAVNATVRSAERAVGDGISALFDPAKLAEAAKLSLSGATALSRLVLMSPDPQTVFKGPLGVAKRAAWSQPIPLDTVKAIGRAVGGTVNDVLLAAVTGALRRYLQERGQAVDGLDIRAAVPVNLRAADEPPTLGNRFGLVFLALPVGADDPLDRLFDLKERMAALKNSPEALVAFGVLNVMGLLPSQLENVGLTIFGAKATAVMTNVPGPRETIYMAGVPLRQVMFWVPQSGRLGLGVSILSYAGDVTLGVATDTGLVPDPDRIVVAFHDEFETLLKLAPSAQE
ncbi:MAG TPA: wax ester/triacylglycerol synthase family O-acyltransferase [Kouleothrix sp.]|uniref:WS/DGAT/MGAT family O-acyltransferase n=1 Tax=Kouleothrix sp. TaxID=2779161 RepID=UPI002B9C1007|nr:wax ester/triacylglycerol synthase family O-acyltransferase [Kouleothrix sp.]HRC74805.1 wax ester/triacylglycerol synthase family O-acyltransferase [Kouleothrix sp.]